MTMVYHYNRREDAIPICNKMIFPFIYFLFPKKRKNPVYPGFSFFVFIYSFIVLMNSPMAPVFTP